MLLADGELDRRHLGSERGHQLLQRSVERGALSVDLVDDDGSGEACLRRQLPSHLGLHLHPVHGRDHEEAGVGGSKGSSNVSDEVRVAGRVDHVQLHAVPFHRRQRQRDARPSTDLLGVVVGDRVAVLHLAHPCEGSCREQQGLVERGLPGSAVADEGDVPDGPWLVEVHRSLSMFAVGRGTGTADSHGGRPERGL